LNVEYDELLSNLAFNCKLTCDTTHRTYASKPQQSIKGAHPAGESITSVAFARDGNMLLSRCADGTLNVWDVRKATRPLKTFDVRRPFVGFHNCFLSCVKYFFCVFNKWYDDAVSSRCDAF